MLTISPDSMALSALRNSLTMPPPTLRVSTICRRLAVMSDIHVLFALHVLLLRIGGNDFLGHVDFRTEHATALHLIEESSVAKRAIGLHLEQQLGGGFRQRGRAVIAEDVDMSALRLIHPPGHE